MDGADGVRPGEIEQIVVAAHLAVPGVEARAAKAFLVEPERLDHRAHGAVEHENALGRGAAQRGFGFGTRHGFAHRPMRAPSPLRLRRRRGAAVRPQPKQMADRIDQVGAVHGVEVEIGDAVIDQIEHLFGGDRGSDQLARRRIVVEAVEAIGEPGGHRGAGARGEILGLREILHRQDAGHDRDVDAGRAHAVEIAEIKTVLEKELGDRARRAGIDLGLEHVDVGGDRGAVRMLFRIGGDRDFDVARSRLMPATSSAALP